MSKPIVIKTASRTVEIPEGKPCIVQWKSKNKTRPGVSTAVGWVKRGERPGTILLVHSAFETYDRVEREYPAKWTIFLGSILSVTPLHAEKKP